ncbi:hypothetical protein [Vulcanisaeta sp. JCM 16159]|uniref:hypothetical protein n=1 Tax=Vulcanisaeta sp. JCM 16159 TaxID=1295371 RepID=UPI003467B2A4
MLEYLEKGPWPSYVTELKKTKYPLEPYAEGLARKYTPWYSGSFRVRYVFSGILARRSRDGKFVEIHFRTYAPAGRFYSTSYLRKVVEVAKRYGIGLVEFGGNTGALVMNMIAEKADEAVDAIRTIMVVTLVVQAIRSGNSTHARGQPFANLHYTIHYMQWITLGHTQRFIGT